MSHTVCIAGLCRLERGKNEGDSCVILCSDARVEVEGVAKGNVPFKAQQLTADFAVMSSGTASKAKELIDRYSVHLSSKRTKVITESILDVLRKPLADQHRADVSEYLSAAHGMTYKEFLQAEPHERPTILAGFYTWVHSCQLILVWLAPWVPRIFVVTDRVYEEQSFATIGVGCNVAQASLMSRNYVYSMGLRQSLYHIYEAKRASEMVPGVGDDLTYLTVLKYDQGSKRTIFHPFSFHSFETLADQYKHFGPKQFVAAECPKKLDLHSFDLE
jgi:hypothetical protein